MIEKVGMKIYYYKGIILLKIILNYYRKNTARRF